MDAILGKKDVENRTVLFDCLSYAQAHMAFSLSLSLSLFLSLSLSLSFRLHLLRSNWVIEQASKLMAKGSNHSKSEIKFDIQSKNSFRLTPFNEQIKYFFSRVARCWSSKSRPTTVRSVNPLGPGFELLGAGHCRGPKWQSENWPKVEGVETLKGCAADCERDPGCVAFEVSPSEKEGKFRCVIYGHDSVSCFTIEVTVRW